MEVAVIPKLETEFARLSEEGKQVLSRADDKARELKHRYIGTEHILLGLLDVEEGLGAKALDKLDVMRERVRAQVVRIVGTGSEVSPDQIPFTPRAIKVLQLSLREALSLGREKINSEDILLGLVRENEGVACRILLDFDADTEKVRNEVIRQLGRTPRESVAASSPLSRIMPAARVLFDALNVLEPGDVIGEEDLVELHEGLSAALLQVSQRRRSEI